MQVVVSDVPHCGACKYAAEHGIPIVRYPASHKSAAQSKEHNADSPQALRDLLVERHGIDYVILAGYLKVQGSILLHSGCKLVLIGSDHEWNRIRALSHVDRSSPRSWVQY